jgi:hypothetical protein
MQARIPMRRIPSQAVPQENAKRNLDEKIGREPRDGNLTVTFYDGRFQEEQRRTILSHASREMICSRKSFRADLSG